MQIIGGAGRGQLTIACELLVAAVTRRCGEGRIVPSHRVAGRVGGALWCARFGLGTDCLKDAPVAGLHPSP